jgi:hypothetical protein
MTFSPILGSSVFGAQIRKLHRSCSYYSFPMAQSNPPTTLGESLLWSYANLAMAHAAVSKGAARYERVHYMIRARLHKGLIAGTMNIGALAEDEKLKLVLPQSCCYCGAKSPLSVDHLLPRAKGGPHDGDNMIWSCRSCNSSKGKKDMLIWLTERSQFPSLLLLRRYLKLAIEISGQRGLLDTPLETARVLDLPFSVEAIPHQYPKPGDLTLWVVPLGGDAP